MQSQRNIKTVVPPSGGGGGIVYNVTIKIASAIHTGWLQWLKEEHIPEVIQTGCFTHAVILRLMEVDDTEGPTYAIQYFAESKGLYNFILRTMRLLCGKKALPNGAINSSLSGRLCRLLTNCAKQLNACLFLFAAHLYPFKNRTGSGFHACFL